MSRERDEWIGKTDDTAIPPRVKDRILRDTDDCCVRCSRKFGGRLRVEFDHAIPLILGGENRQSNLQALCNECHGAKTKLDVKLKAKVARVRQKSLGMRKPSRFPGSRQFTIQDEDRRRGRAAMKAEVAYLTQPAPRVYELVLKTFEHGEQRIQLTESQLRLMIADGAAMAYRYAKREEA